MHSTHLLAATQRHNGVVQVTQVDLLAVDAALALLLEGGFEVSPGQDREHVLLRRHVRQVLLAILGHNTCRKPKSD